MPFKSECDWGPVWVWEHATKVSTAGLLPHASFTMDAILVEVSCATPTKSNATIATGAAPCSPLRMNSTEAVSSSDAPVVPEVRFQYLRRGAERGRGGSGCYHEEYYICVENSMLILGGGEGGRGERQKAIPPRSECLTLPLEYQYRP